MKVVTPSRILFLMLALVLALVVAPATLAQDDDIQIGFVVHVVGNPFIQQIVEGAQAAADDLGVELLVGGPAGGDADAQLQAAQDFVAAGADGIAASVPGESMANGLNEIIDSGIPVVQFNLLSTSVNAPYVGERSVESGRILGSMVLDAIGGVEATGKVIIGNCFPGFPVLENRSTGVQEALAAAPGIEILGPFDVAVDSVENYSRWEAQYAANPDALALIGLCAPDVESLGALNEANGDAFVAGGYDLTEGNLLAIQEGHAFVTIGQSPFLQGYLPVVMLVDSIRNGTPLPVGFADSGTQIVTADSVDMGNGLPSVSFDELLAMSSDPAATAEFYTPWSDCITGAASPWSCVLEPIENEGM
ncbi:MAG: substrate-binding domain-containing protein [Burkholderiales bacterium]|nr:substrate-binding domain-containing protein [Anaerolineae bacterium]